MARDVRDLRRARRGSIGITTLLIAIAGLAAPLQTRAAGAGPQPARPDVEGPQTFWVILRDRADLARARAIPAWAERGRAVVAALQATAGASQAGIRARLRSKGAAHRPFWIVNAIRVTGDKALQAELAARPEVAAIRPDGVYRIPEPLAAVEQPAVNWVEWNVDRIGAPAVWGTFGIRGEGIVVANIDSGVEFSHPALVQQYRGRMGDGSFDHNYSWFDPSSVCGYPSLAPCDNYGHGTHTMGTMVGDDGAGGNQIGVAPGARWIAVKGCEYDSCSYSAVMAAGEWVLAPTDLNGLNPRPDLRPHVVNNSWGGPGGDPFYEGIVQAWIGAGIFPAFSNGNAGPYCFSSGSPGDYSGSYSAGAFDYYGNIAYFSSRGPSAFGDVKPNISAPGMDVRSSVPGNGYAWASGTSMASPHVAGTVALMWSGAGALVGDVWETMRLLDTTAHDVPDLSCGGDVGDNDVWGEGTIDAFGAVSAAPRGPTGWLQGLVLDASGGQPVAGATVIAAGPAASRTTTTDASGAYALQLPVGTYALTATAFGYFEGGVTVDVWDGATTYQDIPLTPAPAYPVSGYVRDEELNPIPFGRVRVLSTPIPIVTADASGFYTVPAVPVGSYTLRARGTPCELASAQPLVVDGPETLDFVVPRRYDAHGYHCRHVPFAWIDANTVLPLYGDDGAVEVPLPFPFPLYGQVHGTAWVSTNGFLNFLGWNASYGNGPIPDPYDPNGAVYAFWDDLYVDGLSSVRTEVVGAAPDRRFAIEWRDVAHLWDWTRRMDFEVVLDERGGVVMQYRNIDGTSDLETGGSATVGLEDQTGTVGFQYAFDRPFTLFDQLAISYRTPPAAWVDGVVTDLNDGLPIAGATVRISRDGALVRELQTDAAGAYRTQLWLGSYEVQASATHYVGAPAVVVLDDDGETVTQGFALRTARAVVTGPRALEYVLAVGEARTVTLEVANTGSADLVWELRESGGAAVATTSSHLGLTRNPAHDPDARTTEGLYVEGTRAGWSPTAPGDVLRSWPASGLTLAWGVGYAGNLWISDPPMQSLHEFDLLGGGTGRAWPASFSGWPADMAYDPVRGLMCELSVGGDNGIYCWDPGTGAVVDAISGPFPWTMVSQRGLAYRPDDDTFYVAGWNDGTLYHVKGLSHPDRGAVIGQCWPPDPNISGLAWNPAAKIVWAATNSPSDTIYELDPQSCAVLNTLPHPSPYYAGAGLEMDEAGNLWMIRQSYGDGGTVYLVDSGVPAVVDVPWLAASPASGTVAPGASDSVAVTVDTTGLEPGVYNASLFLQTNTGRPPQSTRITVHLVVSAYRVGVNAGGGTYLDSAGDTWLADRVYAAGGWGYTSSTARSASTRSQIAGTVDDPLYQDARQSPVEYRFDGLPPGSYQLELRFADFQQRRPGTRLFDVIVEGAFALPAHDIVGEVGSFAADDHQMLLVVGDGQLNVRIVERRGYAPPIVNALRVTHRPDW